MEVPMHRPTCALIVAVIVLQSQAPGVSGDAPSNAVVLLEQERTVSTMVIVPPCDEPNSEFANDAAPDFGPFVSLVESIRTCNDATGAALAQQTSQLGVSAMTAAGMAYASASSEVNTVIHAIPSSQFKATFQVNAATTFEITGSLTASGQLPVVLSHAQVRLTDSLDAVVFQSLVEPARTGEEMSELIDAIVELGPGTYTLRVDAVAVIDSTVPPGGTGFTSYDIDFRIVVSGDINGDGVVDDDDQVAFCAAIGSSNGDPNYDPGADLNGDNVIDELDQQMLNVILPPCGGDVVTSDTFAPPADGVVNAADLAFQLGAWGNSPSCADFVTNKSFAPPPDGVVDGADLAYLLGAWGACE
jgi:hypothetical protein